MKRLERQVGSGWAVKSLKSQVKEPMRRTPDPFS